MDNPSRDLRIDLARDIRDETKRLHTAGCTRYDLLYFVGRLQQACTLLLEVIDEEDR